MHKVLIIQARMNSSRLPSKVMLELTEGINVIQHLFNRVKRCKNIDDIIIATTCNPEDTKLYNYCIKNSIKCYRGSENNVLERYYQTAIISNADLIIRCSCDCPLIDPQQLDIFIDKYKNNKFSELKYIGKSNIEGFPDGFDMELFSFDSLREAYMNATSMYDKEHVAPYIKRELLNNNHDKYIIPVDTNNYLNIDLNTLHLSIDTKGDYKLVKNIFENIYHSNNNFTYHDVLSYLNANPKVFELQNIKEKNLGVELYNQAKQIIPGGTQLLSKRPEMFLPDQWPSYYQKANGIEITTLDGIKMKDFCYMAIGASILGYADPDVNNAVQQSVSRGNISTLNCPSEVELTKLLLELHPWADMARYTRASGEACNMAVRIGRAASGKDKVAFCGYHGWHDWYLSTNHNDDSSLDNHLIQGLSPSGVPKALKNTAFPFNYNNFNELKKITDNHDIGCIIMEPQRSDPPKDNFLQKIRNLCDEKGIILILDEVSAAFRLNTGGLHLKLGIEPDLAVFGKSLGNGYASAAVIGRKKYMESAQSSFISSTFFTEDIGFTSAIAMIKKHRKLNVGKHIEEIGTYFQTELRRIADKVDIKLSISGLPCFSAFVFDYDNGLAIKTLYVQKMLERNILAKNAFYLSYAHKKGDVTFYLENIEEIFKELKDLIDNNNIESQLKGPLAHTGFQRLA